MFHPVFWPNTALEGRVRAKAVTADFELVLGVGGGGADSRPTDLEAGKVKRSKVGSFLLSLVLVEVASCGGPDGSGTTQPETPRATTITINPSSVTLSLLDATRPLTATVRDQNGQTFSGTVAWSSDEPLVVGVEGTGLVRALKNGTATVTARSGSVSATVAVTVQQAAVLLVVISGDAHSCIEGQRTIQSVVDDIRIYVSFDSIDGLGGTLGQAGPCIIRTKTGFPVVGAMQFDRQDLENQFLTSEALLPLILHEMGHVLGIGTMRELTNRWSSDKRSTAESVRRDGECG